MAERAVGAGVLGWAAFAVAGSITATVCALRGSEAGLVATSTILTALALALSGVLLVWRREGHRLGQLLCWCSGTFGLVSGAGQVGEELSSSRATVFDLLGTAGWPMFVVPSTSLLPLLFPDGRLPSRRWRWVALAAGAAMVLLVLAAATGPVHDETGFQRTNPLRSASVSEPADTVGVVLWGLSAVAAVLSLGLRWWKGTTATRAQLGLVTAVLVIVTVSYLAEPLLPHGVNVVVANLWVPALLLVIAYAALRHHLWDTEVAVRRAQVYALLMGALGLLYIALLIVLGQLLEDIAEVWTVIVAAGVVLLIAEPARRWCRRAVVRRLYGQREEPLTAIAQLRQDVERSARVGGDAAVMHTVTDRVVEALRSPGARLLVHRDGGLNAAAESGNPSGEGALRVPLVHLDEEVGLLEVARRGPHDPWSAADHHLLDLIAREAGTTISLIRNRAELDAVRLRLQQEMVEGRVRLGRELHDTLGPLLAGNYLAAQGLAMRLGPTVNEGRSAEQIAEGLRRAGTEIRRMIDGLEPGVHDSSLLVEAITDHVATIDRPDVTLHVDVGELPPAVANAAYLVTMEAVTNVVRHSGATTAQVSLVDDNGALSITVKDDGRLGTWVAGVGVRSMRQRTGELGGCCDLVALPQGGTLFSATLPVQEA